MSTLLPRRTVRLALPDKTLNSSSRYNVVIDSVAIKSGVEYLIPTMVNPASFVTKKIQPQIRFDKFIVAGDRAEFADFYIYDPDETIQNGGEVSATLYYVIERENAASTRTAISHKTIYATKYDSSAKDFPGFVSELKFEGLINGASYELVLLAPRYNDEESSSGLQFNKELEGGIF